MVKSMEMRVCLATVPLGPLSSCYHPSLESIALLGLAPAVGCSGTLVIFDVINFIIVIVALWIRRTSTEASPFFLFLDPAIIH